MPLIIEIVDVEARVDFFIHIIDELLEEANCGGLITFKKAEKIKYVK